MKNLKFLFMAALFAVAFSCQKEVVGPPGQDGQDGNANVQSRTHILNWTIQQNVIWAATAINSDITQDIVDNGAVLVYAKVGDVWMAIPFTYSPSTTYSTNIEVNHFLNTVRIFVADSDGILPDMPSWNEIKVVIISANGLILNPNVDHSNYEAVKEAYQLE